KTIAVTIARKLAESLIRSFLVVTAVRSLIRATASSVPSNRRFQSARPASATAPASKTPSTASSRRSARSLAAGAVRREVSTDPNYRPLYWDSLPFAPPLKGFAQASRGGRGGQPPGPTG